MTHHINIYVNIDVIDKKKRIDRENVNIDIHCCTA